MYVLNGDPRYLKFKRKYQMYGPCFQAVFPFLMKQPFIGENMNSEVGWFTLFLILEVVYLFFAYQENYFLIKHLEIDVWKVLYLSLPKLSLVSLSGIFQILHCHHLRIHKLWTSTTFLYLKVCCHNANSGRELNLFMEV